MKHLVPYIIDVGISVIAYILGLTIILGIVLFIVFRYSDPANFQPFEMATVSALLGGFALAGGFSGYEDRVLTATLRRVGALFLVSTIAFVMFGLFLPLTKNTLPPGLVAFATPVVVISFYIGAILFSGATVWMLLVIRRIFQSR